MKDKNYKIMTSFLIITLNLLMFIGIAAGVVVIVYGLYARDAASNGNVRFLINAVLFFIGTGCLILILYNLRSILKSVLKVNPFTMDNVRSLRNIGIYCFVITACYLINFSYNSQLENFSFIRIDSNGVHTDMEFIIFFFAGLFVLILAQVYKQAVEVKEENDYTV